MSMSQVNLPSACVSFLVYNRKASHEECHEEHSSARRVLLSCGVWPVGAPLELRRDLRPALCTPGALKWVARHVRAHRHSQEAAAAAEGTRVRLRLMAR